MKPLRLLPMVAVLAVAADNPPELHSWVLSAANAAVAAISPDVHSVRADDDFVYVESAGLSLHSFGALEANQYEPPSGPRQFTFRIPRHPTPAGKQHMSTPLGVIGVFVTGVPIYNPIGAVSYRDQNIWHLDAVRASKAGISPLTAALNAGASRHSPIIGFALDGYPIYGPFGYDAAGHVRRMTSSYRLRNISKRSTLPDGTLLKPGQEGPDVSAAFPLGVYAEDYEFVPHTGDLDEFNGRWTHTPEYPEGTYAYFLAGWPYLMGPRYYGVPPFAAPHSDSPNAGEPATLTFAFPNSGGRNFRFLENVHERPVHLIVVSSDLAEFAHIHPTPAPGDLFAVTHTFDHGGTYTMYADYTAPGAAPAIRKTEIAVAGPTRQSVPLLPDPNLAKTVDGVRVALNLPSRPRVGADILLSFSLDVNDVEPYLGAWAHIMLVSADRETFIHAHPLEAAASADTAVPHFHTPLTAGPSPGTISTVTGFRYPGIYKLWFQFQRNGRVSTVSWVLRVLPRDGSAPVATEAAKNAIPVQVSSAGFTPSRLVVPANRATRVAFTRVDAQNCAQEVVWPELGIRRKLPPGQTVIIDIPAMPARELHFACGMGMYKGTILLN